MKGYMRINKRGVILIIVMLFMIMAAISSRAMYSSSYLLGKLQGSDEVRRIRGYYAALGGLRYATVLLKNPGNYNYDVKTSNAILYSDLGLTGPENVVITITLITSGPSAGQYDVTSAFSY